MKFELDGVSSRMEECLGEALARRQELLENGFWPNKVVMSDNLISSLEYTEDYNFDMGSFGKMWGIPYEKKITEDEEYFEYKDCECLECQNENLMYDRETEEQYCPVCEQ